MFISLILTYFSQGGNSLQPQNYRPITIPSNILRLVTVRMCGLMTTVAEENNLLGPEQFGFRRGRSTIDAAFVLTTLMRNAKKNRRPYAAAFVDIEKVGHTSATKIH